MQNYCTSTFERLQKKHRGHILQRSGKQQIFKKFWGKFRGRKGGSLALGSTALPAKTNILICIL